MFIPIGHYSPGNDRPGIEYLRAIFENNGMSPRTVETGPGREALICSIPGANPALKPVVLAGHVDVVPADEQGWAVPPFSGLVRDGFVWGRGALDMKGMLIMQLMAFLAIFHRKLPIKRGVSFLALPDEENSGEHGAKVIAQKFLDILNPAFMLNEGGYGLRNMMVPGVVFPIVVAEKLSVKVKLTARGFPGHSNRPVGDAAITRLAKALTALNNLQYPMQIDPVVKETLRRLAQRKPFPESLFLKNPENALVRLLLDRAFKKDATLNAMTRHTICATVLQAGRAANAIPASAEAILDLRLMPGSDYRDVLEDIAAKTDRYQVRVEAMSVPVPGGPTPFDSEAFAIIEEVLKKEVPGALVVPLLDIGGTDSKHFRPHGIPCYDIIPIVIEPEDLQRIHGANERIAVDNVKLGTRVVYQILLRACHAGLNEENATSTSRIGRTTE